MSEFARGPLHPKEVAVRTPLKDKPLERGRSDMGSGPRIPLRDTPLGKLGADTTDSPVREFLSHVPLIGIDAGDEDPVKGGPTMPYRAGDDLAPGQHFHLNHLEAIKEADARSPMKRTDTLMDTYRDLGNGLVRIDKDTSA